MQIFISYSRKDIDFVRWLAEDLEKAGYDVWWDLTDLRGGDDWPRVIRAAVEASQYFIVVLSPDSVTSDRVEKEYRQALGLRKKTIPIMLRPSEVPFALNTINYVNFQSGEYADNLNNLLSALGSSAEPASLRPNIFQRLFRLLGGGSRTKEDVPSAPRNEEVRKGPVKPTEEVHFTAFHPNEGTVGIWHTLLVYTHTESATDQVRMDAKRFIDQIQIPRESSTPAHSHLTRGAEINIVPTCEGVIFNPSRVTIKWLEEIHRADFRFIAEKSLSGDAAKGKIDIYAGPLIVGSLKFAMLFNDKDNPHTKDREEHTSMYSKDDVFISYSRKDKEVARAFKNILEATGFDVFLDVDDIRTGQFWQEELLRRIERAKIFQIFWSQNYSESENCRLEWQHALKQNKEEGYIRPVFWKSPLSPNPPEELNKFNFKYVELNLPAT